MLFGLVWFVFFLLILIYFSCIFYAIFRERPPSVEACLKTGMSHQDSGSIWDHSRTAATNSCLGSWQDVSIDEWNFLISDFGIVHGHVVM